MKSINWAYFIEALEACRASNLYHDLMPKERLAAVMDCYEFLLKEAHFV